MLLAGDEHLVRLEVMWVLVAASAGTPRSSDKACQVQTFEMQFWTNSVTSQTVGGAGQSSAV